MAEDTILEEVSEVEELPIEPPEEAATLPPELVNLASELDKEELLQIGKEAVRLFEDDLTTRTEWEEMHAHWVDLYYQNDKPLKRPWEGSSDESMPLVAEACNQFHARALPNLFPNRNIIKGLAVGSVNPQTLDRAERIGKHMSWQLMDVDKTYKRNKDSLILSTAIHGSMFTKTYYDPIRKVKNVVKNVRAIDLVVPYGTGPRSLEDIERKTEIIWTTENECKARKDVGYFHDLPKPYTGGDSNPVDEAAEDAHGVQPSDNDDEGVGDVCLLEQHCLLDLDDDGIAEPYIVTVDRETEKVLRIAIRYEVDEMGNPVDEKRPIEFYTHWMFLPNPDGFYGLGMGHLIGRINTAVNKMLRQTIDAGTLQNVKSGFVSSALGVQKGEVELQMGKFITISNGVENLGQHIQEMKFSPPSQAIIETMIALMGRSDRLATVTEALTGQLDKVVQPTALMALMEQGLTMFSTIYERLWMAWEVELAKIYDLNRKYMGRDTFTIYLPEGPSEAEVTREDYADDMMVIPVADPKMVTDQQKFAKAEAQFGFLSQNPLCVNNPQAFWEASKRMANILEIEAVETVLPPPQAPEEPPRVDDPREENMGALFPQPDVAEVFPDQDHEMHIAEHTAFMEGPYAEQLTPEGKQAIEAHAQTHWAFLYGQRETNIMERMNGQEAGPLGGAAMAPQPNNGMVPGGLEGGIPPELALGGNMGPLEQG